MHVTFSLSKSFLSISNQNRIMIVEIIHLVDIEDIVSISKHSFVDYNDHVCIFFFDFFFFEILFPVEIVDIVSIMNHDR